jgi:hypothetical protein
MIKLVEAAKVPQKANLGQIVDQFIASNMSTAKLDLQDEDRTVQQVYSGIYGYIKAQKAHAKVQMVDGEIYLSRTGGIEEVESVDKN